jgi:hypothetical protein
VHVSKLKANTQERHDKAIPYFTILPHCPIDIPATWCRQKPGRARKILMPGARDLCLLIFQEQGQPGFFHKMLWVHMSTHFLTAFLPFSW